ncbi:MAG: tetratricopeptide repeat protein, partial [Nitrospinales bacterium]
REKEDVRYLYTAALVYGISAGNHATVAFYLPAILVLFFCWNREDSVRRLSTAILFFLVGLSVYLYLPMRSLAEPTFDWGNPETVERFLYHVTDRKDAATHFSYLQKESAVAAVSDSMFTSIGGSFSVFWEKSRQVVQSLLMDVSANLSPLVFLGFIVGGFLCLRKNVPIFIFFLLVTGVNASFFVGWQRESYFPSYLIACLWTSLFIFYVLSKDFRLPGGALLPWAWQKIEWKKLFVGLCLLMIPWTIAKNYYQVGRSDYYLGETFYKRVFLSQPDRSIYVPGMSWFNFNYHNDVTRLRDDVTSINAWDLLSDDPPSILTQKRYADLKLPDESNHRFDSQESSWNYFRDLIDANITERPIILEQNLILYERFPLVPRLRPYKNLLLQVTSEESSSVSREEENDKAFEEFKSFLQDEIRKPGIGLDPEWIIKPGFLVPSFAFYFHDKGWYAQERDALRLGYDFLGQRGLDWQFKMVDNLIQDQLLDEARDRWEAMRAVFPDSYEVLLTEGMLENAEGNTALAIQLFQDASRQRMNHFRPHLEMAKAYLSMGLTDLVQQEYELAHQKAQNLREISLVQQIVSNS